MTTKPNYIEEESVVSCAECKCLLKKTDATPLKVIYNDWDHERMTMIFMAPMADKAYRKTEYYCAAHKREHVAELRIKYGDTLKFSSLEEFKEKTK